MKIPVFVSCASNLSPAQDAAKQAILGELDRWNLQPRTIGVSDYPVDAPLKEVVTVAGRCSGGLILGFEQLRVNGGVSKPGTVEQVNVHHLRVPTPWNNLEAGVLFALGLPLLILKEKGVVGGVFDEGASGYFVSSFDPDEGKRVRNAVGPPIQRWHSRVHENYYNRGQ